MAAQYKFDATKPFYASVGAGDLAVEKLRQVATDLQGKVEGLRSARVTELQVEAKSVLAKLEAKVVELGSDLNDSLFDVFDEQADFYSELVTRGESRIAKLRDDSIAGDVEIIDDSEPVKDVPADVEVRAAAAAEAAQSAEGAASVIDPTD